MFVIQFVIMNFNTTKMKNIPLLILLSASLTLTANAQKRNDLNASEYNGTANSTTGINPYATPTDYKKIKIDPFDLPLLVINSYSNKYASFAISESYAYPFYWNNQAQYYDFHSNSDTVSYSNWNNQNAQYYELICTKGDKTYKSTYAKDGTLMNTMRIIKESELPVAVAEAFKKSEYKNWDITEKKEAINKKNKEIIVYKIKVRKGNDIHTLRYYVMDQVVMIEKRFLF